MDTLKKFLADKINQQIGFHFIGEPTVTATVRAVRDDYVELEAVFGSMYAQSRAKVIRVPLTSIGWVE